MKGSVTKVSAVIFFLLLSGWYLYPSLVRIYYNNKLDSLSEEERAEYEDENYAKLQRNKERALNLGLDLQGGMHVTLEVGLSELLAQLAGERRDDDFDAVLATANTQAVQEGVPLVDAFVDEFQARDPSASLSRYFRSEEITRRSDNAEVTSYLRSQGSDAVTRAIEIIRSRVDRFGVTEPSIQTQGGRRIVVELPGIDDPERVRRLLKGTARLEFRLMADPGELNTALQRIIEHFEVDVAETDTAAADEPDETDAPEELPQVADGADAGADAEDDTSDAEIDDDAIDIADLLAEGSEDLMGGSTGNTLLDVLRPAGQGSVVLGEVEAQDTAAFNAMIRDPEVLDMLPRNIELLYHSRPSDPNASIESFAVLGVNVNEELSGETIVDARVDFDQTTNQPLVAMTMNSEGSRIWSRLTGANVGKNVAIVLDGVVYSYPTVISKITGGNSQITGLGSRAEAEDVVTVLKSGALPAPVNIVEERTVGPSLGMVSRQAGFTSIMVGLFIVAIFMMFYYRGAGGVADLALLINIIFILGILAGFQATLTLPGIAGIVLTIGMAVDANVLIFERVREEEGSGKTLKASIDGGYSKALSAIIDANITTFFVGVILYSFGVGPIKGFAVTLMAGILASLFSAIVFTRIIFDYVVLERRGKVSFG